jgi:hypothetical protein
MLADCLFSRLLHFCWLHSLPKLGLGGQRSAGPSATGDSAKLSVARCPIFLDIYVVSRADFFDNQMSSRVIVMTSFIFRSIEGGVHCPADA